MSDEGSPKVRPRWLTLSAVLGVGAAFVAWAIGWQGRDAWPGIFVNIGTGFVLAGILVFIEPRFTRRLSAAVTKNVAETVTTQVAEATEQRIAAHIDDLEARFAERIKERVREREATVDSMERPTFDSVMNAFDEADRMSAISAAAVTVPANKLPSSLVCLKFTRLWMQRGDGFGPAADRTSQIGVMVLGVSDYPENFSIPWQESETAEEMGVRIVESLRAKGAWRSELLDWPLGLRNLQLALRTAVSHRSGEEDDKWFSTDSMQELLDKNWIVTYAGIESCDPDLRYVFKWDEIPGLVRSAEDKMTKEERENWPPADEWPPPPPGGLTTEQWHTFLYKAIDHHKGTRGSKRLIARLQVTPPSRVATPVLHPY
ncbi:hypothetical protein AB0C38_04505 [Amycolatopsis sp. NPDC048633]|uniref:PspA/IM30 family protein n=1 Tax=Amycolatopsis sp. NPDC048633 TaxID=3157095 RepID=UPI0033CD7F1B